jgi:membrane protease YdiL (CAAX protease family)
VTTPAPAERRRRWIELGLLFGVLPGLMTLGPRWTILPAIMIGGAVSLVLLLRDPSFPRQQLGDARALRRGLGRVLARTAAVWVALLLFGLAAAGHSRMFYMPRTLPRVWLAVILLYPPLSAYPQEVMYRAFFFHRYGPLFRRQGALIIANAVLFGWAHAMARNFSAVLLTTVGGLLFASTYARSRSTLLVAVEHALYGAFVFTVGVGGMFVNGVRLLSAVLK